MNYDQFMKELKAHTFEELVMNYLEAKTGTDRTFDDLPVNILDLIEELSEYMNEL